MITHDPLRAMAWAVILQSLSDARSTNKKLRKARREALAWLNSPEARDLARLVGLCWPRQIDECDVNRFRHTRWGDQ